MAIAHVTSIVVKGQLTVFTFSGFTVSGTDPALIVDVALRGTTSVTSVTWNGAAEAFTEEAADNNSQARSTLLSLNAPTATTDDVVVTLAAGARAVITLSLYNGVDQTTVFRAGSVATNNGSDDSPTVNITGTSGDIIVDSLAISAPGPPTATADHTERSNDTETGGGDDVLGASQELAATGGADAMGWSMSAADNWALCAGALLPASAGVTAELTGTMLDTVDEDDITTGGKTVIITLTGDTFKAAGTGPIGSTADTQALIDGFDAASSPTNGWNNEVRDKALTSEVVRTSSTIATWTVAAQSGYDISSQETITGTIPTDVLVTGAGALTATPTFTIDQVAAGRVLGSLAYKGGLAGKGGIAGIGGGLAG